MNDFNRKIFETAYHLWESRADQYRTRLRLKRYTYGDQWSDTVSDCDGIRMPERDAITRTGKRPISNNLIRRLVKTIVGRYRDMADKNGWYDSCTDNCDLPEVDCRVFEEFLISGISIQRIADDDPMTGRVPRVTNVDLEHFLCNDFRDPCAGDVDIVGMLHDMSPAEVYLRFGGKDGLTDSRIQSIIDASDGPRATCRGVSTEFFTARPGRVRIVEVWSRQFDNLGRLSWWARWFDASGNLLKTYISPWKHASHPFVFKFYPLTDGEVHSFVEDIVDQQRYINRLIVIMDQIMATSAKGVLLFPVTQKVKSMSWEEVARRWASPDSVIPVTGYDESLPRQITTTGGDANAFRLLEMELKLFDQTSGVGAALLGQSGAINGVTGIQHYQAQVENATIALADIFGTFRSMIKQRDAKFHSIINH